MRLDKVIAALKWRSRVVVTGPARSGTAIGAVILARELGLPCLREEEFDVNRPQRFFWLVNDAGEFVLQAPCMSSLCHWLEDVAVVFMVRDVADVAGSQRRVGWAGEALEAAMYFAEADDRPIAEIKYHHWHTWQKAVLGANAFELDYESMCDHPLWVGKDDREDFGGRQTAPWDADCRESWHREWPVPRAVAARLTEYGTAVNTPPDMETNMPQPIRRPATRAPVRTVKKPDPTAARPLEHRSRDLNHGAPAGFLRAHPAVIKAPLPGLPVVYAVVGTWFEGDVIAATVKNCLANGCSKVYVVDNDSPDDTVAAASGAGAEVGRNYRTEFYDDDLRLKLMNDVMREVTEREGLPNMWWLSLDADEFPCGPHGERVIDYLKTLDGRINCVAANAIDLYPTEEPYYTTGMHPADCMKRGLRRKAARGVFCPKGHWKHPLLRYENGDFNMAQSRGSHVPFVRPVQGKAAFVPQEPDEELIMFHAPMRARETTFRRLQTLCTKQEALGGHHRSAGDDVHTGGNGAIKRWRSLEHVYSGRWDQVELPHSQVYGNAVTGIALFDWRKLVPGVTTFPRWYPDPAEVARPAGKVSLPLAQAPTPPPDQG